MNNRVISKTSIFPASKQVVFGKIQKLSTLQYIAFPYATFKEVCGNEDLIWKSGQTFKFKLRLFGIIPLGIHSISVIDFDEERGIYTIEGNRHVPVWNHRIILESINHTSVRYTDEVEIGAGWKTPFVFLWAKMFYAHRQRKWIKLLRKSSSV